MRNLLLIFTLCFSSLSVLCQEKRTLLAGKVMANNSPIADVHIINKNTSTGTISNDKGFFEIPIRVGDSISFSHLNLKERVIIISKTMFSEDAFTIQLTEKTYALDEIRLEKSRSILYQETIPNHTPIVNATTLRLPYANSVAKKDHSVFKVRCLSDQLSADRYSIQRCGTSGYGGAAAVCFSGYLPSLESQPNPARRGVEVRGLILVLRIFTGFLVTATLNLQV